MSTATNWLSDEYLIRNRRKCGKTFNGRLQNIWGKRCGRQTRHLYLLHRAALPWFHFLYSWQLCERQRVCWKKTAITWIPPTQRGRLSLWSSLQGSETHVTKIQSGSKGIKLHMNAFLISSERLQLSQPRCGFECLPPFCSFQPDFQRSPHSLDSLGRTLLGPRPGHWVCYASVGAMPLV